MPSLRGCLETPRAPLASAGACPARTQPVKRGTATRAGEDAAWRVSAPPGGARGIRIRALPSGKLAA
jgi:hypothetical protein